MKDRILNEPNRWRTHRPLRNVFEPRTGEALIVGHSIRSTDGSQSEHEDARSRRYATPTYDKNITHCCVGLSIPKNSEAWHEAYLNDLRLAGLK